MRGNQNFGLTFSFLQHFCSSIRFDDRFFDAKMKTPPGLHSDSKLHSIRFSCTFLVADTRLYTLQCRLVGRSVTCLNSERFLNYCSCPTVRDWIAVYPALFLLKEVDFLQLVFHFLASLQLSKISQVGITILIKYQLIVPPQNTDILFPLVWHGLSRRETCTKPIPISVSW